MIDQMQLYKGRVFCLRSKVTLGERAWEVSTMSLFLDDDDVSDDLQQKWMVVIKATFPVEGGYETQISEFDPVQMTRGEICGSLRYESEEEARKGHKAICKAIEIGEIILEPLKHVKDDLGWGLLHHWWVNRT